MKKFLSVLLALAMIFSLTVTVSADETKGEMDGYVVVLHTNDVHGAISGYAKVAALKKAYEAEGAYVLLMDAGDFCQGDPTVSVSQGKTAVELMNMAGYDVTTLGNHEFDYGYDNLVNLSKEAKFPIVAANVLYQGKVAFNSNQIFTTPSGVKIGVFGLETPETATKAHPAKIKGVTILGDKSMFDCAQAQVDSLKADGCDYIICLGHLGIDKESLGNRSTDLLNVVDGIDVFIDGHSHSTMKDIAEVTDKDGKVNGTLLTSTGTKLANVGVVTISPKGKVTAMSAPTEGMTAEDKDVAARAAAIKKEIDDDYGTVFAKTKVELDGVTISSTYIRSLVEAGEVERAARFLGHPHRMSGTVCHGEGIGRKRLFPTANLVPDAHIIVPKRGVYATRAYLTDGTQRVGVTNVGVRPTVSEANRVTVETYLAGFDGDLYGQDGALAPAPMDQADFEKWEASWQGSGAVVEFSLEKEIVTDDLLAENAAG